MTWWAHLPNGKSGKKKIEGAAGLQFEYPVKKHWPKGLYSVGPVIRDLREEFLANGIAQFRVEPDDAIEVQVAKPLKFLRSLSSLRMHLWNESTGGFLSFREFRRMCGLSPA